MAQQPRDYSTAYKFVQATLAADCACDEALLSQEGVFIIEARQVPGRRYLPFRTKAFCMLSMGAGVVISVSTDRLTWAQEYFHPGDRDTLFSIPSLARIQNFVAEDQQDLAGPDLKFVCATDTLCAFSAPAGIRIELIERANFQDLYTASPGFHNALGYRWDSPRPDMLAVVARQGTQVVGVAGVSADSEHLWQVGVDVLAAFRGQGIGKALVSRITLATLAAGKVPYYSTRIGNLRSSQLACSLGYRLAWTEVYVKER